MNDEITLEYFVSLVEQMRQAQKRYFQTRLNSHLMAAKEFESRVDKEIRTLTSNDPEQEEMF